MLNDYQEKRKEKTKKTNVSGALDESTSAEYVFSCKSNHAVPLHDVLCDFKKHCGEIAEQKSGQQSKRASSMAKEND